VGIFSGQPTPLGAQPKQANMGPMMSAQQRGTPAAQAQPYQAPSPMGQARPMRGAPQQQPSFMGGGGNAQPQPWRQPQGQAQTPGQSNYGPAMSAQWGAPQMGAQQQPHQQMSGQHPAFAGARPQQSGMSPFAGGFRPQQPQQQPYRQMRRY
jgi:hypothetical protein